MSEKCFAAMKKPGRIWISHVIQRCRSKAVAKRGAESTAGGAEILDGIEGCLQEHQGRLITSGYLTSIERLESLDYTSAT